MERTEGTFLRLALAVMVVAAIVAGLLIIDSPWVQRKKDHDAARIQDLIEIESRIERFNRDHERLPTDLVELKNVSTYRVQIKDRMTGVPYGYELVFDDAFRLCATFEIAQDEDSVRAPRWAHGVGQKCSDFDVITPKEH